VRAFRSTGGKGWRAYVEIAGQFDRDPYHGLVPRVVMGFGQTKGEAVRDLESRLA